jgi:hypothetical protein
MPLMPMVKLELEDDMRCFFHTTELWEDRIQGWMDPGLPNPVMGELPRAGFAIVLGHDDRYDHATDRHDPFPGNLCSHKAKSPRMG